MQLIVRLFKLALATIANKIHVAVHGYPSRDTIANLVLTSNLSPLSSVALLMINDYVDGLSVEKIAEKRFTTRTRVEAVLRSLPRRVSREKAEK